ncbi:EAL domain-containing protein [Motiliproteus coralliicola]|uniref:EAL domain-containing protein n=1 Tax=Motiliproteus coralliicola TaxID=2283196 RepID=A0A369WRZ0_9GAMM|nr:EAL domain-containing protein [Motiliproteus coralliicola]RDE24442.1 EAL domain-containing protein [Motiliproteus coralliicola]
MADITQGPGHQPDDTLLLKALELIQQYYQMSQQALLLKLSRQDTLNRLANQLYQAITEPNECRAWLFLESDHGAQVVGDLDEQLSIGNRSLSELLGKLRNNADSEAAYPAELSPLLLQQTYLHLLDLRPTQRGTQARVSRLYLLLSTKGIDKQTLRKVGQVVSAAIHQTLDLFDTVRIIDQQEKVFDTIPMPLALTDAKGVIHRINPAFSASSGYPPEELLGHSHAVLKSNLNPPELYQQLWQTISAGKIWHGELANKSKSGEIFWEELTIIPLKASSGKAYAYVSIKRPTTREHRLAVQAQYHAEHDQLTGLFNVQRMRDDLQQRLDNGTGGAIIFADIGSLSRINQSLGLDVGDKILQDAARCLERGRVSLDQIYRYNGDTFAIILDCEPNELEQQVESTVSAIHLHSRDGASYDSSIIPFNLHIGIVRFPEDGTSVTKLFGRGALALRSAKKHQDPAGAYFSIDEETKFQRQARLEQDIQHALKAGQLQLWYQPKVDARTHMVAAAEALLRWKHPEYGWVSPEEFIPLAESNRAIINIGRWVINQAIADASCWQQRSGPIAIAFNMSAIQLFDGQLLPTINNALARHQLNPELVVVELTESVLIDQPEFALSVLQQMIDAGLRVSIDDFGTGYSSMSYLRDFPVHEIKIDRSLVRNVASNPAGAVIVNTILSLGKNLDLEVVAEGVEQTSEAAYLSTKGCDLLQGYLFSKPIPNPQFMERLDQINSPQPEPLQPAEHGVLFLDDEANILRALKRELHREPYPYYLSQSADDAFEMLAKFPISVVVSDQRMPDIRGTEFLARVHKLYPRVIRIMLSGYTDSGSVIEAINTGVVSHFLTKPWDGGILKQTLNDARRRFQLESESRQNEGRLEQLSYAYMITPGSELISKAYQQAVERHNETVSLFFSSSFEPSELFEQITELQQLMMELKANHFDRQPDVEKQFDTVCSLGSHLLSERKEQPVKGHEAEVLHYLGSVRQLLIAGLN